MTAQAEILKPMEILRKASENLLEGTLRLRESLTVPDRREEAYAAIAQCRAQARAHRAEAIRALARTASIRRDPRLVGRLIEQICALPTPIEKAAARAKIYRAGTPPPGLAELAGYLERAAQLVLEAAGPVERDDPHELSRAAADLNGAIEAAEAAGNRTLSALFEAPEDPLEVLKGQDLLHRLGDAVRGFRDIARRLEALTQGAG